MALGNIKCKMEERTFNGQLQQGSVYTSGNCISLLMAHIQWPSYFTSEGVTRKKTFFTDSPDVVFKVAFVNTGLLRARLVRWHIRFI